MASIEQGKNPVAAVEPTVDRNQLLAQLNPSSRPELTNTPQGEVRGKPLTPTQAQNLQTFATTNQTDLQNWRTISNERVAELKAEFGRQVGIPKLDPSSVSMKISTQGGSGQIVLTDRATDAVIAQVNFPGTSFAAPRTGS